MPYFDCKIAESSGKVQRMRIAADNVDSLRAIVERQGNLLLASEQVKDVPRLGRRSVSPREMLTFTQELYVLVKAGQPVVKALEIILESASAKRPLTRILEGVLHDVEQGLSLSEAMEKHPECFPPLYLSAVRAGEKGGNLVQRLREFLDYTKKSEELRRQMVSSSIYPVMIVVVIIAALLFLFTYVIPSFSQIYLDANVELPFLTRMILLVTRTVWVILPVASVTLVVLGIAAARFRRTDEGRMLASRMKFEIPLFRVLYRRYVVANFARTLSAVLKGGIPLVSALRTASDVTANAWFSAKLDQVIRSVEEGQSLSSTLATTGVFEPISLRLIKAGEGTGALEEMLDEVSEYYDSLVVETLRTLTTLVEPAMMLVLGAVVGIIVIAMYLPIFNLAGAISG